MSTPSPLRPARSRTASPAARSAAHALALAAALASTVAGRAASAEENRYNLHVELGPLLAAFQPAGSGRPRVAPAAKAARR
jgi:hypothetical protein